MKLIVGLGNPGAEYRATRHNIGFDVVDRLAERAGASGFQKKFKGELLRGQIAHTSCLLFKPQTYMNRSGIAVALAREYYSIAPHDLIVVHDEVDLSYGRLRIKSGGGHAGHNGLRSLIDSLGTRDFVRVRVGIGRPAHGSVTRFVLAPWGAEEREWLPDLLDRSADAIEAILRDGTKMAMNRFNAAPDPADPGKS